MRPRGKYIDTTRAWSTRRPGRTRADCSQVPPRWGPWPRAAPRAVLALVRGGHHLQARNRCSNPPRMVIAMAEGEEGFIGSAINAWPLPRMVMCIGESASCPRRC